MADSRDQASSQVHTDKTIFSPDDVVSDRYRVVRFIARGGMGEVYEVEDWELRARIALKTIAPERASSPQQIGRFRHEIQLARKVSHPNVCRVFDLGRQKQSTGNDVLFLTMELLTGQTLHDYINQHGPLTTEEALPIVRQMVSALAAAHQLGIVHRDFKPANVMLEETPQGLVAKVTDFGLATTPESEETVSRSLQVLGTPEYMAPEQFRGQCSNQTDVYAMGITVYQMLTGKLPPSHETPFKGGSQSGTGKRVPQRWREAITKCLASNPADRFATVEEFWRALSGERLVIGSFGQALAGSIRRHRVLYSLAACAVIAVIALMLTGVLPSPFRRLPQQKHIAVLPFQNIGNDASNQAFAEGVAETLTSKLSQL
jgi:serine/threonine protein kinase